jgi:hypothetical protein
MCECGHEYTFCFKQRHLHSQLHKDRLSQETKSILCPCGGKYVEENSSRHFKSKLRQSYVNKSTSNSYVDNDDVDYMSNQSSINDGSSLEI